MANMNVTYQEMHDAATKLTTGKDDITGRLNDLKTYIGQLVTSGFVTDQASVQFNDTYQTFTTSATNLIGSLDGLSSYLNKAADAIQNTDQQLASGLQ